MHLDVEVGDLGGLRGLGATVVRAPTETENWWIMADAEGGEFCAFVRPERRPCRAGCTNCRMHIDVTTPDVDALVTAGAVVLREPDDETRWHVMADPEGNEFCAFTA